MERTGRVRFHDKYVCCRVHVKVIGVTQGFERVGSGRVKDAVFQVLDKRDGDVANDAAFPEAFAPRDGREHGFDSIGGVQIPPGGHS